MSIDRLVVVGGSLAGLRAVEAARKAGFSGSVTLIGAEEHLPYDRPPLSKAYLEVLEGGAEPEKPYFRSDDVYSEELDVELMLGRPATGLDTVRRVVTVGGEFEVGYDALVIATGAAVRHIPGTQHLEGVFGLRTLDDSIGVRAALDAGARTVVIGAGFIGSEVASGANKRGVEVTIVEALPTPLVRATGKQMGAAIAALHERNGTTLRCGTGVAAIEGDGRVERVVLDDGTVIPADLVVVGIGVAPCVEWLEGSGLTVDNGIVCDANLWTGAPGVYAAGDVANWVNPVFGIRQRMENWTAAAEQGAAAARNALDPENAKPYGTVPYFWSDWYDVRIQFVGLPDADEVVLVDGDTDQDGRWVALYRQGDRLIGALTVNGQTEIMKYRVLISKGATWQEGLDHAAKRHALAAEKAAAAAQAQCPPNRGSRQESFLEVGDSVLEVDQHALEVGESPPVADDADVHAVVVAGHCDVGGLAFGDE
ncbi:NAD(P)/FAD-dependent oxidoreductase [Nocardioides marmoriginsengisoli]|uniref:NAD(P)/FAD-dependent oxidoreductase n=1 Tax=Nocardioides marmoriginsengisoli TaxID=661483 RepID=UPI001FE5F494|nr:FAD-dependent oxidoreductase [Nocardioides marmoriginsengisoli]